MVAKIAIRGVVIGLLILVTMIASDFIVVVVGPLFFDSSASDFFEVAVSGLSGTLLLKRLALHISTGLMVSLVWQFLSSRRVRA